MILEAAIVAQILGTRMPPSTVKVGTSQTPNYRSVHYFDNLINVTNRVLDRSIRADIVRVHPEALDGAVRNAQRNQAAVETHCQTRLMAEGIPNAAGECGHGL